MNRLKLQANDFESLTRWTWILTEPSGHVLAEHRVRIDPGCWQYQALFDLDHYVRSHSSLIRRAEQEAEIVYAVGTWIGENLLGTIAPALVSSGPAVVRVEIPPEATQLAFLPLELCYYGAQPLALQDVTLVMCPAPPNSTNDSGVAGDSIRILGLFSLPTGTRPLHLRKERRMFLNLFERLRDTGKRIDVEVLQYGVTRDRLSEVLAEGDGWDLVHISGHGVPGELILEREDGSPDPITAVDLAKILEATRERLKLVVVSACFSAALTTATQRELTGLAQPQESASDGGAVENTAVVTALVLGLISSLNCAILAMRYPVNDDFAMSLASKLYKSLIADSLTLPKALNDALSDTVSEQPDNYFPVLSVATPALFGRSATELRIITASDADIGTPRPRRSKLEGFPDQPERFVGRTVVMSEGSAALAPRSGASSVLLYGIPGGGKTACALELAYTHEQAFDEFVWFELSSDYERGDSLTQFAIAIESQMQGVRVLHLLANPDDAQAFANRLVEVLSNRRVLIVVDNIESQLLGRDQWIDVRWRYVISAMTSNTGPGKVIITSRWLLDQLDSKLRKIVVNALSLDESLLLAREMPRLNRLISGKSASVSAAVARSLAMSIIRLADGHPKLLELADGQADDIVAIRRLVAEGSDVSLQPVEKLRDLFEPHAESGNYATTLMRWTEQVVAGLTFGEQCLFYFLCRIDERDRRRPILEACWIRFWTSRYGKMQAPEIDPGLLTLKSSGLISFDTHDSLSPVSYSIQAGVAVTGLNLMASEDQEAADEALAWFWGSIASVAHRRGVDGLASQQVVLAGVSSLPYLLRLGQWNHATQLIAYVLAEDPGRTAAAQVVAPLVAMLGFPASSKELLDRRFLLAIAHDYIGVAEAEHELNTIINEAERAGALHLAEAAAGRLSQRHLKAGRTSEAMKFANARLSYNRKTDGNVEDDLQGTVLRLQIMQSMGNSHEVLTEVYRLVGDIERRTTETEQSFQECLDREALFNVAQHAAASLERWTEALQFNAAEVELARRRGAPASDILRFRFPSYLPLVRVGELDEAERLLNSLREFFERTRDVRGLGEVFTGLATVESTRRHEEVAASLSKQALRYNYAAGDVSSITANHNNLGNHLRNDHHAWNSALAHHLAAALLHSVSDQQSGGDPVEVVKFDLMLLGGNAKVPSSVEDLCYSVAEFPEVKLDRLLSRISVDSEVIVRAFTALVDAVRASPFELPVAPEGIQLEWDPVIACMVAALDGNEDAARELEQDFHRNENSPDWSNVTRALKLIYNGERNITTFKDLDGVDFIIVVRAIAALDGRLAIPIELWPG